MQVGVYCAHLSTVRLSRCDTQLVLSYHTSRQRAHTRLHSQALLLGCASTNPDAAPALLPSVHTRRHTWAEPAVQLILGLAPVSAWTEPSYAAAVLPWLRQGPGHPAPAPQGSTASPSARPASAAGPGMPCVPSSAQRPQARMRTRPLQAWMAGAGTGDGAVGGGLGEAGARCRTTGSGCTCTTERRQR